MFLIAIELSRVLSIEIRWQQDIFVQLNRLLPCARAWLEKAGAWDRTLDVLLELPSATLTVKYLIDDTAILLSSPNLQKRIASVLMGGIKCDASANASLIMASLHNLGAASTFATLHEDLRIAVTTWLCRFEAESNAPHAVAALRDGLRNHDEMTDSDLQAPFHLLSISIDDNQTFGSRNKRRRIRQADTDKVSQSITVATSRLLATVGGESLSQLQEVVPAVYTKLTEDSKCTVWQDLTTLSDNAMPEAIRIVCQLFEVPELNQSKKPRILSMLALRACAQTTKDPVLLDLKSTNFGKACTMALHSSIRELRVAAAYTLPLFLRDDLPEPLRSENRQLALEFLRSLSDRDAANEQETLIMAWGQVALSCGEKELNLVLLRLVEYLGHRNSHVCAVAATEIEKLATISQKSVLDLLRPFWRSIAVSVARDLLVKPQKAQQLVDLLEIDLNAFLLLTERETVPSLVLSKNRDVLQKIATARGKGATIQDVCLYPRTNLASILTLILSQPVADPEELVIRCLQEVAPSLKGVDVSDLIQADPAIVACEMLKYCSAENEARKAKAHQTFRLFAAIAGRASGQRRSSLKSDHAMNDLFERMILGILFHFSEALESSSQSRFEKVRSLGGIAEMVILTKGQVSLALPQIRACLQSGIEQDALRDAAFEAWLLVLSALHAEDITRIVDETFALIVQHWTALSTVVHEKIHNSISLLVKAHNEVLQDNIMTLPSLEGIQMLAKFAAEFKRLKALESTENHFKAFSKRLRVDSNTVVLRALHEVVPFLEAEQQFIHDNATSENPAPTFFEFLRALLDTTAKMSNVDTTAAELCGKALGIVGCLDPNRIETTRKERTVMALSNFADADEAVKWVVAFLEEVLVKTFKSVTNPRAQGFLAFVIQELLAFCKFREMATVRTRSSQDLVANQQWMEMPEHVRITLTPLLTSKYSITAAPGVNPPNRIYPSFSPDVTHSQWLRSLTFDLMLRATGDNAKRLFLLLSRTVRTHDAIASFLLPYAALNLILGGTSTESQGLSSEFIAILECKPNQTAQWEVTRLCSESVFAVLDYMSSWLREKRLALIAMRSTAFKAGISPNEIEEIQSMGQIETVENFSKTIPAVTIANRAMNCGSDARALFHWEHHIRQKRSLVPNNRLPKADEELYERLLDIYSQIDEPDGLEGISAHLNVLTEEQRAINHSKAGRWTAAQAWYELKLADEPLAESVQTDVLRCLRETGQYIALQKYADSFRKTGTNLASPSDRSNIQLALAVEASFMNADFASLRAYVPSTAIESEQSANVGIAKILLSAHDKPHESLLEDIRNLRGHITKGLSFGATSSLQTCHDELSQLHVLYEIETLANIVQLEVPKLTQRLSRRLAAVGSYSQNKQYILGIRRAVMGLRGEVFPAQSIGAAWLTTARLARQTNNAKTAHDAVLKAFDRGEKGAKLEEARLLWQNGHQRQAISLLDSAINSGVLADLDEGSYETTAESTNVHGKEQNLVKAKALLLLAKWLDASGQSQTKDMTEKYQMAARQFQRWEKGHYYLGKHYSKLLDAQKALPIDKRSHSYESGEMAKLVIDNTLRSIPFGNKYWHETIPRSLTLWLELGMSCMSKAPKEDQAMFEKRTKSLQLCNRQLQKYFDRVSPYVFYPSLSQLISRITHPHPDVWKLLSNILIRIASMHPSQALWSFFAVVKSRDTVRVSRGTEILLKLKDPKNKSLKTESNNINLGVMITQGQKLCDGLLQACETPVEPRASNVRLGRDLNFNHKLAPCQLVVPVEATLLASSPSMTDVDSIRRHKAFTQENITIQSFAEEVLVLSSLQRPKKITARGSDGRKYGLLCKPKDDLRKDQRLMEFNGIINRALKRDDKSSKRRLYIKTYAVTPLSEESGTIEWVEGIKPIRDILLGIYNRKGIRPDYTGIKRDLEEACKGPKHIHIFEDKVLSVFPPSMHEWFAETYPEPDAWFAARLRYARSAAVMSMTGHMLGLGDRHGENILLEESTGGVFHVDFNCLFDKGLTFEKPELVPFRLTHNMQDAMGPYGHEGPFRTSSELTMGLLRQERDTLMTVLETFLYDPTTDFIGKKKRSLAGVPETPSEILESVATKLRGLLRGETVPLSVEGYVDALIQQATSHANLAGMYIGWCSFL
jgi:serine/threonine-protein kinase ATR